MAGNNSGGMSANFEGLTGAAGYFELKVNELETMLSDVTKAVENLASDWSGTGFLSFNDAMAAWNKDVASMNNTLLQISQNVKESSIAYQDTDAAVTRSFGGFH